MPISKHFAGKGRDVMAAMRKTYGPEEAKRVFYATENARKKHALKKAMKGKK